MIDPVLGITDVFPYCVCVYGGMFMCGFYVIVEAFLKLLSPPLRLAQLPLICASVEPSLLLIEAFIKPRSVSLLSFRL